MRSPTSALTTSRRTRRAFTTDEVWVLDKLPKSDDACAIGKQFIRARESGAIENSDLVSVSNRGVSLGRPINVWLSRRLGATMQDAVEYVVGRKKRLSAPTALLLPLPDTETHV